MLYFNYGTIFILFQISYIDVFGQNRTFGPIFHVNKFLIPLLRLQKDIQSLVAEDGTTLSDVCNAPLFPKSNQCNVQSIWSYWQDDVTNLFKFGIHRGTGHNDTYLDHFLMCSR